MKIILLVIVALICVQTIHGQSEFLFGFGVLAIIGIIGMGAINSGNEIDQRTEEQKHNQFISKVNVETDSTIKIAENNARIANDQEENQARRLREKDEYNNRQDHAKREQEHRHASENKKDEQIDSLLRLTSEQTRNTNELQVMMIQLMNTQTMLMSKTLMIGQNAGNDDLHDFSLYPAHESQLVSVHGPSTGTCSK